MSQTKLYQYLESYVQRFPQKKLFFYKKDKQWLSHTCNEIYEMTLQTAVAFERLSEA